MFFLCVFTTSRSRLRGNVFGFGAQSQISMLSVALNQASARVYLDLVVYPAVRDVQEKTLAHSLFKVKDVSSSFTAVPLEKRAKTESSSTAKTEQKALKVDSAKKDVSSSSTAKTAW